MATNIIYSRDTSKDIIVTEPTVPVVSKLSNGTTTYALKDANAYHQGDLATVATSGSYDNLSDQPSFNGIVLDNTTSTSYYGESTTAAATVQKEVSIPSITKLEVGQVIIVKPTITSTVANSTLKLNNFDAYPMRYGSAAITTSTDSVVWYAEVPSTFVFDGTYWRFVSRGGDNNTTYTMNYTVDAGNYKAGTGSYAISRYSLILQKPDGTWEKPTNTAAAYSTATTKTVNTNGFLLNRIKYYGTTTNVANGALVATNVCYDKAASVDLRYSTNCGATTTWAAGEFIYLVGSINSTDGLFYLDTTQWWTNALPTTNDGKLYIRLGIVLTAASYTMSFLNDRPIYYYNGTKLCEYFGADNKQDLLVSGTTIKTVNNQSILGSGNLTIDSLPAQSGNANKFLTTDGSSASWANLATVATSGSYSDLSNKPTINDLTTTAQQNALNSGITTALVTQIGTNQTNITTINNKIPSAATSSNQLADKAFVNSSINAVAAYYITADATGNAFATKAALDAGPYYHDGTARTPTENDYAIVSADETHNNTCTRYSYTGSQWSFQYIVNDTPFTQAQINAINSGITSTLVSNYSTHIADTTIHVTSNDKTTWNGKQAAITGAATTITSSNLTASRALISNSSGKVAVSDVTSTELGYLDGVTSAIQTQLNNKVDKTTSNTKIYATTNAGAQTTLDYSIGNEGATIAQRTSAGQLAVAQTPTENTHAASKKYVDDGLSGKEATITGAATTITSNDLTAEYALVSDSNGKVAVSSVTATELGYVSGVTSAIQTQLGNKVDKVTSTYRIYGTNNSGAQTTYSLASGATASTIAYRGTGGVLQVGTPTANAHATTKKYVDDNLATKQATLVSGTNIKTVNGNNLLGSGDLTLDCLPAQSGNTGKYLATDGTDAAWMPVVTYDSTNKRLVFA